VRFFKSSFISSASQHKIGHSNLKNVQVDGGHLGCLINIWISGFREYWSM